VISSFYILRERRSHSIEGVRDINKSKILIRKRKEIIMEISKEEQKKEALKRMKMWNIFPETIRQFGEDDLLSESCPPFGACYWVEGEQLQRVKEFEEKHNALVYFVIHGYTNIGEIENYLYVSASPEEWELDEEYIQDGCQVVYVYNHDMPDCSEFGSIGIERTAAAGLKRTW
jgi:hypothetical protein